MNRVGVVLDTNVVVLAAVKPAHLRRSFCT
jgi:hypothetical protein